MLIAWGRLLYCSNYLQFLSLEDGILHPINAKGATDWTQPMKCRWMCCMSLSGSKLKSQWAFLHDPKALGTVLSVEVPGQRQQGKSKVAKDGCVG